MQSGAGQLPRPAWDRGTGTAPRVLNIHSVRVSPFAGRALGPRHRWDAGGVPPWGAGGPPVPGVGEEQREPWMGGGRCSTRGTQRRPRGAPRCHPPHRRGPAGLHRPVLPSSPVGCSCRTGPGGHRGGGRPSSSRPSPSEERPRPSPRAASRPAGGPHSSCVSSSAQPCAPCSALLSGSSGSQPPPLSAAPRCRTSDPHL